MQLILVLTNISLLVLIFFTYRKFLSKRKEIKKIHAAQTLLQNEINQLKNQSQQTLKDPVTHLLSWQLFEDRLTQSVRESARYQSPFSVLYVDVDNFKVINNALGYAVGDAVLKEVAARLQKCIRQVDSLSRCVKDTFVILLAQLNKPETSVIIAQRILQSFTEALYIQQHELFITVSIGIAVYPTDGEDAITLLRNAEQALHLAKAKGENHYFFYEEKMNMRSQRELALHAHMHQDHFFQELIIYYQATMNVATENIFAMDAILHWQHRELGLISSNELFDYAAKQRMLNSISEWLLRTAVKQFLHWRTLGFSPEYLVIPITIQQLQNTPFIYSISKILQELNFPAKNLLLKIDMGPIPISNDILSKSFNMLTYMGVKMLIDNFGANTFSLSQLKIFPIHYLKLSPTFIDDISTNEASVKMVKAIILLAQSLAMQMIAQGVELPAQLTILQSLGCSLMQGKLFGEPLLATEVILQMTVQPS